jgi:hypothetical protein
VGARTLLGPAAGAKQPTLKAVTVAVIVIGVPIKVGLVLRVMHALLILRTSFTMHFKCIADASDGLNMVSLLAEGL